MAVIQIDHDTFLDLDKPGPLRPDNWLKVQDEIICPRTIDEIVEEALADAERRREDRRRERDAELHRMLAAVLASVKEQQAKPVFIDVECPLCRITVHPEELRGHVGSLHCQRNLLDERIIEVTGG